MTSFHNFLEWLLAKLGDLVDRAVIDKFDMWSKFHQLRSGSEFQQKWKHLLVSVGLQEEPIFYQNVTLQIFEMLIKMKFIISDDTDTENTAKLTYEEENAVRYVGGYILRSLKKESSKDEDLLLAVNRLIDDNFDKEAAESEEWTAIVDRGGLVYITDHTYKFFCSIEYSLRKYLKVSTAHKLDENFKSKVTKLIIDDDDVQFYWVVAATEIDEETSERLLNKLIEKWIVVLGFSFANSILEMYKVETKKGTQKSKGLRHTLADKQNQ